MDKEAQVWLVMQVHVGIKMFYFPSSLRFTASGRDGDANGNVEELLRTMAPLTRVRVDSLAVVLQERQFDLIEHENNKNSAQKLTVTCQTSRHAAAGPAK